MSVDILMPALSPTMEEGTLAKWHVKAGDTVKAGDVIAEIETDKATMEVEAVDEGVVGAILVPAGTENVKVNTPIARLGEGAAEAPSVAPDQAPGDSSPKGEHPQLRFLPHRARGTIRSRRRRMVEGARRQHPSPSTTPKSPPGPRWSASPCATPCATPWPRRCVATTPCS